VYVIHHFKATELSCVGIAIRLFSIFKFLLREMYQYVHAIRNCKKENSESKSREKRRNNI
jgi:hypothetical protein